MNKINGIKGKKIGTFRKKIRIPGILGAFGGRGRSLLEFRALPAPGKFPICAFYGKKKKTKPDSERCGGRPGAAPLAHSQPGIPAGNGPAIPPAPENREFIGIRGELPGFGENLSGFGGITGIWGLLPRPPRGFQGKSGQNSREKLEKSPETGGGSRPAFPDPAPQIPGSGSEGCGNRECSLQKEGKREKGGAGRGPRRRFPQKTVEFWGERGGGGQKFPVFRRKLGFLRLKGRIWGGKGENGIRAPPVPPGSRGNSRKNSKVLEGIGDSCFFSFFHPKIFGIGLKKG